MENRIDIEGYKKVLEGTLDESKKMLTLLSRKTIALSAKINAVDAKDHQYNDEIIDAEISLIKTNGEMKVLSRIISDKEKYFKQFFIQFNKDAADCNEHWEFILNRAKMERNKNNLINGILGTMEADMEKVYADPEIKLGYYKTLKKQLNNETK